MDCGIPIVTTAARSTTRSRTGTTWSIAATGRKALRNLHSTNNFPEFTGRVCPAPCEASCTLNLNESPVTIKTDRMRHRRPRLGERLDASPEPARVKTGKKVAVIGSGPAGLAAAQQLARAGHDVHVYEKFAQAGGLLRYGIPDFKMEKGIIDRRVAQMAAEGVHLPLQRPYRRRRRRRSKTLLPQYDARRADRRRREAARPADPRPRPRAACTSRWNSCRSRTAASPAKPPPTVGADPGEGQACRRHRRRRHRLGLHRHLGAPGRDSSDPARNHAASRRWHENKLLTWPNWPLKLRTSSSHQEGAEPRIRGDDDEVHRRRTAGDVKLHLRPRRRRSSSRSPAPSSRLKADLVLLAMGFVAPVHEGLLEALGVELDHRGNVKANVAGLPDRRSRRFSPPATCAAASRWSSGPSARAANAPAPSTSS